MPNSLLYLLTIALWGSSWFVIKLQLGQVAPEVSVFYRFLLAALILQGWCVARGRPLRYGLRGHLRFAFIGLFLFNLNYISLYYASFHLTTGLVAVLFSSIQISNMVIGKLVLGDPVTWRMVLGALIGITGIALVFSPEIHSLEISAGALVGLVLALGGTFSASVGMISSARFQREGYPVLQTNTWGMTWGALWMLLYVVLSDIPFDLEPSVEYVGGMLFLSIFSTVIGFGCFLTLVGRIGAGRASYAMVMFPIVALMISTAFEAYTWSPVAAVGLGLAILGNIVILMDRQGVIAGKTTTSPA